MSKLRILRVFVEKITGKKYVLINNKKYYLQRDDKPVAKKLEGTNIKMLLE
jgi:hypothetical protein